MPCFCDNCGARLERDRKSVGKGHRGTNTYVNMMCMNCTEDDYDEYTPDHDEDLFFDDTFDEFLDLIRSNEDERMRSYVFKKTSSHTSSMKPIATPCNWNSWNTAFVKKVSKTLPVNTMSMKSEKTSSDNHAPITYKSWANVVKGN